MCKSPPARARRAEFSRCGGARERQLSAARNQCNRSNASVITSIMIVRTGSDRISEWRTMKEPDSISNDCAWIARLRLHSLRLMLCCCRVLTDQCPPRTHESTCAPPCFLRELFSAISYKIHRFTRLTDLPARLSHPNPCCVAPICLPHHSDRMTEAIVKSENVDAAIMCMKNGYSARACS